MDGAYYRHLKMFYTNFNVQKVTYKAYFYAIYFLDEYTITITIIIVSLLFQASHGQAYLHHSYKQTY